MSSLRTLVSAGTTRTPSNVSKRSADSASTSRATVFEGSTGNLVAHQENEVPVANTFGVAENNRQSDVQYIWYLFGRIVFLGPFAMKLKLTGYFFGPHKM